MIIITKKSRKKKEKKNKKMDNNSYKIPSNKKPFSPVMKKINFSSSIAIILQIPLLL